MNNKSIRVMLSIPQELNNWLVEESKKLGVPKATFVTILINEAKDGRAMQGKIQEAMERVIEIDPDKLTDALQEEFKAIKMKRDTNQMKINMNN